MNSENAFKKLGQKLMNGEITPEEHLSYQKAKEQALQEETEQGNNA